MSVDLIERRAHPADSFRHEALFYRGEAEFVQAVGAFITDGVAAGDPVLVVVSAPKIAALEARLGPLADHVQFADMAQVGRNPARIIPAWREFVRTHATAGSCLRGVGEPIDPNRSADELVECHRHEELLNLAFAGGLAWWLLCPYDLDTLDGVVVDAARRNHPFISEGRGRWPSPEYAGLDRASAPFDHPLPEPPDGHVSLPFALETGLIGLRNRVCRFALRAGLGSQRVDDLVVAVNELATNSLRYGGGEGVLRMWQDGEVVVCEVSDHGHLHDSLAGRARPPHTKGGGRGLWLVNHLCDLVQLRTFPTGTVVRVRMSIG